MASKTRARARASGHSFNRRLVSKLTATPAARAMSMAACAVSQLLSEMASVMPDRCSTRAAAIRSRGRSAGRMRLAAEPWRKKLNSCPCGPWLTKYTAV